MHKVRLLTVDSGTSEQFKFDTEVEKLEGKNILGAYLDAFTKVSGVKLHPKHTVEHFMIVGDVISITIKVHKDAYFGDYIITGIGYLNFI